MRYLAWALAVAILFVGADANAYSRVARRGAFGAFLSQLGSSARHQDMRALRRMTDRDFTVGEELDRSASLGALGHDASMRLTLAAIADHGACYRTAPALVQCELPDPGPNLDHTKRSRSSIAIFERTRHGWKLGALYA
jgi:hypothetical protein